MTETATTIEGPPEDAIYFLPGKDIYPDPEQPRVEADAELAASIKEQGIHQAITVRPHPDMPDAWLLVDGERRWRGASAAGLKEIPARIRLDLEDPADRLIAQITANTGRPLTAIEQASAFKKILDADPKLTQDKLAKRLGIPKSTVGDRLRLLALAEPWQRLLREGVIQTSHAPILHRFRDRPEDVQAIVAKAVSDAAISLADNGRSLEIALLDEHVGRWFDDPEYAKSEAAIAAVLGDEPMLHDPTLDDPIEGTASIRDADDDGFEERPSALDPPEIQRAHQLATAIEEMEHQRGAGKTKRKLIAELHDMPFWDRFRFEHLPAPAGEILPSGFMRFMEFVSAHNKVASSGKASADRAVSERFGVPHITSVTWRQAPGWFHAASWAHGSHFGSLQTMVEWKVGVTCGTFDLPAWSKTREGQLKQLRQGIAEHRAGLIEAIVKFSGEKRNYAEGMVDRYIAKLTADAEAKVRNDLEAKERAETERVREWEERPRPTRTFTDTEIVDGIAKFGWFEVQKFEKGRVKVVTDNSDPYDGEDVREALAVAIERYQVEPGAPIEGADDDLDDDDEEAAAP